MTDPLDPLRAVSLIHTGCRWLGVWLFASLGPLACVDQDDAGDTPPPVIVPGGDSEPPPVMTSPDGAVDQAAGAPDAASPDT